jgi:hypothetical protein
MAGVDSKKVIDEVENVPGFDCAGGENGSEGGSGGCSAPHLNMFLSTGQVTGFRPLHHAPRPSI